MIRAAHPHDAPAIADIWNDAIRTSTITFTTQEKTGDDISRLIAMRAFWVAHDESDVAGFAAYGPFRAGPGYRFSAEHSVYVRRDVRGAGHGSALMAALEAHAAEAGIRVLVAGIGGENPQAQAFHARLGFRMAGELPDVGEKFGREQTLIFMTKKLWSAATDRT